MRYWIEYILDVIVQIVFFPYFMIRRFVADRRYENSFVQEPRETLYDKISRNGGSFLEYMSNEHPIFSWGVLYVSAGILFAVAVLGAFCGPY